MNSKLTWHGKEFMGLALATRRAALLAGTILVEGDAKERCPVGIYPAGSKRVGGNLKSSIHHGVDDIGSEGWVGTNVHYGPHVEFGTVKMQPRSFLRPALDENHEEIIGAMSAILKAATAGFRGGR